MPELNTLGSALKDILDNEVNVATFTEAEKTKLAAISEGAEVNPDPMGQAEATSGTATDERTITAAVLKAAVEAHAPSGGGGDIVGPIDTDDVQETAKTGDGTKLVTAGDAGTNGDIALWDAAGNLASTGQVTPGTIATDATPEENVVFLGFDPSDSYSPVLVERGVIFGTEELLMTVFLGDEDVEVGDGAGNQLFRVPASLDGWTISNVEAYHQAASSDGGNGTTSIQLHNVTDAVDVLSTALTIDAQEADSATAATAAVINPLNDLVAEGDKLRVDVDVVAGSTVPKGLWVNITFTF